MRGFLAALALLAISGFVYWVGPALTPGEWVFAAVFVTAVAVMYLFALGLAKSAARGDADMAAERRQRQRAGDFRMDDDELADVYPFEPRDVSHVRHKGLGR